MDIVEKILHVIFEIIAPIIMFAIIVAGLLGGFTFFIRLLQEGVK